MDIGIAIVQVGQAIIRVRDSRARRGLVGSGMGRLALGAPSAFCRRERSPTQQQGRSDHNQGRSCHGVSPRPFRQTSSYDVCRLCQAERMQWPPRFLIWPTGNVDSPVAPVALDRLPPQTHSVIWGHTGDWPPLISWNPVKTFRRHGPLRNDPLSLLCATITVSRSHMCFSRRSRVDAPPPSRSPKTRRDGSRPISPSYPTSLRTPKGRIGFNRCDTNSRITFCRVGSVCRPGRKGGPALALPPNLAGPGFPILIASCRSCLVANPAVTHCDLGYRALAQAILSAG